MDESFFDAPALVSPNLGAGSTLAAPMRIRAMRRYIAVAPRGVRVARAARLHIGVWVRQ